jgi:serine/threonine protein kinase
LKRVQRRELRARQRRARAALADVDCQVDDFDVPLPSPLAVTATTTADVVAASPPLGHGSFGTAHVVPVGLDRFGDPALPKVLKYGIESDDDDSRHMERTVFASEVVALAALNERPRDAHVVAFYGWYRDRYGNGWRNVVVTERAAGVSAFELGRTYFSGVPSDAVARQRREAVLLTMAARLLDALLFLRGRRVVHGDLSLTNVVVLLDTEALDNVSGPLTTVQAAMCVRSLKLIDFGLARFEDRLDRLRPLGPTFYRSPDMAAYGSETLRASTALLRTPIPFYGLDVWFVGIGLLRLACGLRRLPWRDGPSERTFSPTPDAPDDADKRDQWRRITRHNYQAFLLERYRESDGAAAALALPDEYPRLKALLALLLHPDPRRRLAAVLPWPDDDGIGDGTG